MIALLPASVPSPRRPRTLATLVATLLVVLTTVVGGLALPSTAHADPPGPGDDFPLIPAGCQNVYQQLPFVPCHATRFGPSRPLVVLWGDSHAWMYQPAVIKAAREQQVNLVMLIAGGCPPAIVTRQASHPHSSQCLERTKDSFAYIKKLVARHRDFKLILGSFWSGYRIGWHRIHDPAHPRTREFSTYARTQLRLAHYGIPLLFKRLGRLGVRTDVIGQAATIPPKAPACPAGQEPYQCTIPRRLAMHDEAANKRYLLSMMADLEVRDGSPRLIDATPAYCDATTCFPHVGTANTWYDDIHLGAGMTRTLTRFFRPSMTDLVRASGR